MNCLCNLLDDDYMWLFLLALVILCCCCNGGNGEKTAYMRQRIKKSGALKNSSFSVLFFRFGTSLHEIEI